jgi:hypothetical protein
MKSSPNFVININNKYLGLNDEGPFLTTYFSEAIEVENEAQAISWINDWKEGNNQEYRLIAVSEDEAQVLIDIEQAEADELALNNKLKYKGEIISFYMFSKTLIKPKNSSSVYKKLQAGYTADEMIELYGI